MCDSGEISKISGTLDISAGKLIDRTGVKLGMDFPCGASLQEAIGESIIPKVKLKTSEGGCNLSGFENKVDVMIANGVQKSEICAFVIGCVIAAADLLLRSAQEKYGELPVVFAGGVSSNLYLREYFTNKYNAIFPSPHYAQDNAAGIALLAEKEHYGW